MEHNDKLVIKDDAKPPKYPNIGTKTATVNHQVFEKVNIQDSEDIECGMSATETNSQENYQTRNSHDGIPIQTIHGSTYSPSLVQEWQANCGRHQDWHESSSNVGDNGLLRESGIVVCVNRVDVDVWWNEEQAPEEATQETEEQWEGV